MKVSDAWRRFSKDPFGFVDNELNIVWRGNNLNFFQKTRRVQSTAFWFSMACLALWIVLGFDSTPLQFVHALYEGVPGLLTGQATLSDVAAIYHSYYGKEMHYSAFVIYGLTFWALSRHLDQTLGMRKSQNIAYSCGVTFLSISIFEFFWIYSFSFFQGQSWVSTWQWPQLKILLQNTTFFIVGVLTVVNMYGWSYKLDKKEKVVGRNYRWNWNPAAFLLIALSVASALLWIYYPWPTQQIQVTLDTGQVWRSSPLFPQTLYTVDLDPTDSVNAGVWFYVHNDAVHALNTIVKTFWTATILYVALVKKAEPHEKTVYFVSDPTCFL